LPKAWLGAVSQGISNKRTALQNYDKAPRTGYQRKYNTVFRQAGKLTEAVGGFRRDERYAKIITRREQWGSGGFTYSFFSDGIGPLLFWYSRFGNVLRRTGDGVKFEKNAEKLYNSIAELCLSEQRD
jgi:hypothetical protein